MKSHKYMEVIQKFTQSQLKTDLPNLQPGYLVKVHQIIKEGGKERIQVFEGLIIAIKHGRGINGTITVRKISSGIGVERTFPVHSPLVKKIEVIKKSKVRRAKLFYLRKLGDKKVKMKERVDKQRVAVPEEGELVSEEVAEPVEFVEKVGE